MKIIYAGFNFFSSVLDEIIHSPDHEVLLCMTGEKGETIQTIESLCEKNIIELHHGSWTDQVINKINGLQADLLITAAYSYRVPVEKLNTLHCINLHPSLLPMGRGPNPLPELISAMAQHSGLTIHKMTPQFDDGSIIIQTPIAITKQDGFDTLSMKMFLEAPKLIRQFFLEYPEIINRAKPQNGGEYWSCCSEEERTINWYMGIDEILDIHKKYGAVGVIFPFQQVGRIEVFNIIGVKQSHEYPVGEIVLNAGHYIYVSVHDGILRLWLGMNS
jgi:methionyl-tRNA formyltransferase